MKAVTDKARALESKGVRLRGPKPKPELVEEVKTARVMLYKGDINETFCAAVAEAQALGVPAVVQPIGSLPERVVDGETGVVTADDARFADAAVDILSSDETWRRMHDQALTRQRSWGWQQAADAFEALIPPAAAS